MIYDNLSEEQTDALKEMGNIGVGQAATALSKMLNQEVDINIPETKLVRINEVVAQIGGPEEIVNGIYLQTEGDLSGKTLFLFKKKSAMQLIDMLMFKDVGTTTLINEMGESALKELSNVFTGAYLTSLSDFLGISILPGIPHITTDMLQALVDNLLISLSEHGDKALYVQTKIIIQHLEIEGAFLFFFDNKSLSKILEILSEKFGVQASA